MRTGLSSTDEAGNSSGWPDGAPITAAAGGTGSIIGGAISRRVSTAYTIDIRSWERRSRTVFGMGKKQPQLKQRKKETEIDTESR
jgi:hypothetical protein